MSVYDVVPRVSLREERFVVETHGRFKGIRAMLGTSAGVDAVIEHARLPFTLPPYGRWEIVLLEFEDDFQSEEALQAFRQLGLQHPRWEHGLLFLAQYPLLSLKNHTFRGPTVFPFFHAPFGTREGTRIVARFERKLHAVNDKHLFSRTCLVPAIRPYPP